MANAERVSGSAKTNDSKYARKVQAAAVANPTAPGASYVQAEAASMRTQFIALRDACKAAGIIL